MIVYILLITAATIDRVASETLAKVEEKCPIITKTPTEVRINPFFSKLLTVIHMLFLGGTDSLTLSLPELTIKWIIA